MIRSSLLAGARRVAAPVALSLAVATASAPALAASQRTFVSTTGVDNPACSIAAPCRGFAAAIAHRGLRLVRLPTTTLSQADSGVGVKNSVNLFGKKNWIGTCKTWLRS